MRLSLSLSLLAVACSGTPSSPPIAAAPAASPVAAVPPASQMIIHMDGRGIVIAPRGELLLCADEACTRTSKLATIDSAGTVRAPDGSVWLRLERDGRLGGFPTQLRIEHDTLVSDRSGTLVAIAGDHLEFKLPGSSASGLSKDSLVTGIYTYALLGLLMETTLTSTGVPSDLTFLARR